jgi:hypothetical protein
VVKRFTPAFSGGDGDIQIIFDPGLPIEIGQAPRPQAGIERSVLYIRLP